MQTVKKETRYGSGYGISPCYVPINYKYNKSNKKTTTAKDLSVHK